MNLRQYLKAAWLLLFLLPVSACAQNFQINSDGNYIFNGVTYNWPNSQGASNTALGNDGSGNLSWVVVSTSSGGGGSTSPGGSPRQVQYNLGGAFAGDSNFQLYPSSAVYSGSSGFFTSGNAGLTSGGAVYVGNAFPFSGSGGTSDGEIAISADKASSYGMYLIHNGPTLLNAPSGSTLQGRVGNSTIMTMWQASGNGSANGDVSINCGSGELVTQGVFNICYGNAALENDQNSISEFFVKNTSQGSSAGALIAVEGHNGDNDSQPEGWFFLGGHGATSLSAPHAPDTVEIYGRNGAKVRLSTQESNPIDFWTNATQRMIIASDGSVTINAVTSGHSACFTSSQVLGHCTTQPDSSGACTCAAN